MKEIELVIEGGQSFLDPIFGALKIDPIEGFQLLDVLAFQCMTLTCVSIS